MSNVVHSQVAEHSPYGGVVPEIASRAHIMQIEGVVAEAMKQAQLRHYQQLDAVAVTAGPGLIGGVIVGLMMAKSIASATNIPLIGVNHLEGHALTPRLCGDVPFPFLLLLVSGGHCQILVVEGVGRYTKLGSTIDDALGEAFDKTAKMLGLGYPGGPIVEAYAAKGNDKAFDFPRPLINRNDCDFSFSGLKTAIFRLLEAEKQENAEIYKDESFIADVCASFQAAAGDVVERKMKRAIVIFKSEFPEGKHVVVAGGVAANQYLRNRLNKQISDASLILSAPPLELCTDNGAMIAWAGMEKWKKGQFDDVSIAPKARWPLFDTST